MWFSVSEHLSVIVYALFMGIFLGALFDFFKLIRSVFTGGSLSPLGEKLRSECGHISGGFHKSITDGKQRHLPVFIVFFIFDVLFATVAAIAYSLFLFHAIRGQVRWYFIASTFIGFFIYRKTVGRLISLLLDVLFVSFTAMIGVILRILLIPAKFFIKLLYKPFKHVRDLLHNLISRLIKSRRESEQSSVPENHTV